MSESQSQPVDLCSTQEHHAKPPPSRTFKSDRLSFTRSAAGLSSSSVLYFSLTFELNIPLWVNRNFLYPPNVVFVSRVFHGEPAFPLFYGVLSLSSVHRVSPG